MKLLDNSSRLNKLVVSQGLRVASGDCASLYVVFKQLERRVNTHLEELEQQYSFENCGVEIRSYLKMTAYRCINRLDKIHKIQKLKEYQKMEDINAMIYEITGRNVAVKIQKILLK